MNTTSKIVDRHIPCPLCSSSDAYCTYDDGHGYCFSCNNYIKGDNTIGNGLSDTAEFTYEFLGRRGITPETFRHFGSSTKVDRDGKPVSIGFRYPNGAIKVRLLEKKEFYWQGESKPGLYAKDLFAAGSSKYITITEGEYDAHSLHQVLKYPVVSVQSSSSALRDCSVDRDYLNSFERIYLAFDADAPGRESAHKVAKLFDRSKVYIVSFSNRKDANEYLQHGEATELKNIWWNSKNYVPENVVSSLEEFKAILNGGVETGISYPWPTLTQMTYGIRTGECVLLIAQEKVGKTSLMHEILHHLLKETDDAIGAFFLEEPKKRLLQSLAGISLRKPVHLPDTPVQDGEVPNAIEELLQRDDRLFVYDYFGSGNPDVLLDAIRYLVSACDVRYVLLDHLTMAFPGLSGDGDERRTLDYLSTRLEMLVKELDFSLIMVSHVNDGGQTRGSRWPTKVSDITIRATRDLEHPDPYMRNVLHLSVPFNRFCSSSGPAGDLLFDNDTYTYHELVGGADGYPPSQAQDPFLPQSGVREGEAMVA